MFSSFAFVLATLKLGDPVTTTGFGPSGSTSMNLVCTHFTWNAEGRLARSLSQWSKLFSLRFVATAMMTLGSARIRAMSIFPCARPLPLPSFSISAMRRTPSGCS